MTTRAARKKRARKAPTTQRRIVLDTPAPSLVLDIPISKLREYDEQKAKLILTHLRGSTESRRDAASLSEVPWSLFRNWFRHSATFQRRVYNAEAFRRTKASLDKDYRALKRLDRTRPTLLIDRHGAREQRVIRRRLDKLREMFPTARLTSEFDVGGRRSTWTLEKTAIIAHHLMRKKSLAAAYSCAGVAVDTGHMWRSTGRVEDLKTTPDETLPEWQFFVATEGAIYEAESHAVSVVDDHIDRGSLKAATWYLSHSRLMQARYSAPSSNVNVGVGVGITVNAAALRAESLSDDAIDAENDRLAAVLALHEQP